MSLTGIIMRIREALFGPPPQPPKLPEITLGADLESTEARTQRSADLRAAADSKTRAVLKEHASIWAFEDRLRNPWNGRGRR